MLEGLLEGPRPLCSCLCGVRVGSICLSEPRLEAEERRSFSAHSEGRQRVTTEALPVPLCGRGRNADFFPHCQATSGHPLLFMHFTLFCLCPPCLQEIQGAGLRDAEGCLLAEMPGQPQE